MKKNITINMCGRLFQIDEDAYELLQKYLESLHQSFGKLEDGEEIVGDIEARVAELFDELCAQGIVAITIEHVEDIITRIGKPEELTGNDEEQAGEKKADNNTENQTNSQTNQENTTHTDQSFFDEMRARTAGKTLYRNPCDKMVAGVLSGFAAYTGTDAAWWRIGYALLFVASNFIVFPVLKLVHLGGFFFHVNATFILLYIILALVLPVAKTPKQILEMQGKDVTPQSLADVVIEEKTPKMQTKSTTHGVLSVFLQVLMGLFMAVAVIVGLVLLVCFVLIAGSIIVAFTVGNHYSLPFDIDYLNLREAAVSHPWAVYIFVASVLMAFLIPLYGIVHMLISKSGKIQPMSTWRRILWSLIWVVCMFSVFPSLFYLQDLRSEYDHRENPEMYRRHDPLMSAADRHFFKENGFRLMKHKNIIERTNPYTSNGEYYTGDGQVRYLDAYAAEKPLIYHAGRKERVEPGLYQLECVARAEGKGAVIFASVGRRNVFYPVPAFGNEGGPLGNGWSKLVIKNIKVDRHNIIYGVSTDPEFTWMDSEMQWFSATDFKLTRIGDLPADGTDVPVTYE